MRNIKEKSVWREGGGRKDGRKVCSKGSSLQLTPQRKECEIWLRVLDFKNRQVSHVRSRSHLKFCLWKIETINN